MSTLQREHVNNMIIENLLNLFIPERYRQTRFSSRRIRRRVVFKHGDCNVVQENVAKRRRRYLQDIFTTLVDAQWRWTLLVFALNFLLSWLMFAIVWWLIVYTHGDLDKVNLGNATWTPCVTSIHSFTSCFLFSVETQHTIGYGAKQVTEECPEAIFILCLQSIVGVMIQAFMVGIVFAKLSRPKKRTQTLLFSRNAVICQRDGELCLMFRVGDMRRSHIIEAHVRAQLIRKKVTLEGELLPFYQQELKVGGDGIEDKIFFIWPTTIVHKINPMSPLYTLSAADMLRERFEIVVILEGVIESTGMTTQARSSYLPNEILWGHRFETLVSFKKETGEHEVNYGLFNNTYEVHTPLCSAQALDQLLAIHGTTKSNAEELFLATDYRPISLLSSLSKVLERLIHQQITSHLNRHNLLNPLQSGFRTGHSTCSALLKVSDDIQAAMDSGMATTLVLFDFSKAFDLVSHKILLLKLRTLGFNSKAVAWFGSYLSGRRQSVLGSNNDRSGWKPVVSGVPQGSVLGPLLFSLYINDISSCFTNCRFHLYADDLQIYLSARPPDLAISANVINHEIEQMVAWARSHGLIINPGKTKVMLICSTGVRRTVPLPLPPIEVDGNVVEYVDSARNLGISFDNSLNWSDEVTKIRKKVFGTLWTLRRIKNFTSQNSKILLVKCFALPQLEYCAPLLNGLTAERSLKIQRAQNSCVRFIYNVKRREHITPYFNRARLLKTEDRRRILTLSLLYKVLVSQSPSYLYEKYQFRSDVRSRDTRSHELLLEKPRYNTFSYSKSFLHASIDLWNSVPYPILNSLSFFSFKTSLQEAVSEGLFSDS
ncbi:hypothetical protein M8J77_018974 [Diaphorina citri]|nr:hypothetical protein M8J77_018974 [Diaphorina citri]